VRRIEAVSRLTGDVTSWIGMIKTIATVRLARYHELEKKIEALLDHPAGIERGKRTLA